MIPALARVPRWPRSWPASEVAARRCMGWAPVCAQPVVGTARESVSGVLGYLLSDLGDHAGGGGGRMMFAPLGGGGLWPSGLCGWRQIDGKPGARGHADAE